MTTVAENINLETASLAEVENFIAPRARWFAEVGLALLAIRERRLYLDAGFDDFRAYCRARWEMDDSRARQLCDAALVTTAIAAASTDGTTVPNVETESQARELRDLITRPGEMRDVWHEALGRSGGRPTAALIRKIRHERERDSEPDPDPDPWPDPPPAPGEAQRIFALMTQAAAEAQALGGERTMREAATVLHPAAAAIWRDGFGDAARLCQQLAEACER